MSKFIVWFTKITGSPLLLFLKPRLFGRPNKRAVYQRGGGFIVACNHVSMLDTVLLMAVFAKKTVRFLAAGELYKKNRLFAWWMDKMGFIKVDRTSSDINCMSVAVSALDNGDVVCIFPEGKLEAKSGSLLPFKPGAVLLSCLSGAPVLPVGISGKYGFFSRAIARIGEPIDFAALAGRTHPDAAHTSELSEQLRRAVAELI